MRFNFTFSQALDVSSLFFMEQYVYHSQFTSKFFFGLHNSFLILNYNNSFFCIKRALNFLESSLINRCYILGIGEFYNFFFKSIKFFKYLNILNLEQIPNGFLTNYKQYFTPNKLVKFSTLRNLKKINKKKIKFTRLKNFDNRSVILQRKKKDWISQKYAFNPPSIAILFNISKSYWIINELKLIKTPIIGLIYPKTELDSRIIQYPIPILHGFDFDFNDALLSDLSVNNIIPNISQKPKKSKTDKFKENLIDLFFLFLFILISFQSYKKLILKFITKSIIFFKNNSLVNSSNIFNIYSYKKFNLAKKFYKKSFLRFYIKMWSKIKINSNLFFQNKSIRFIDRSLLWKPKKNQWFLKKWIRTRKKAKAHVFAFRNIYINQPRFWVQKKNVWNFKGFGMLRKLKLKQTRLVPFVNTLLHRNLIVSPLNRISFHQLQVWNYKRFDVGFKNISDLFPFFYKVLRKFKSKTFRRKRRFLFYKYKLSSYKYDTKFLKFGNYSIIKKKKNFKYLYRFKKPLYFSRRFILTRLSVQRKNTLRENLKFIIKSVLRSSDVIKKNRFLGYLRSKVNKNQYILQRKNFLNYYSARYWWLYKKPVLLYLTLKKKKNKKFIQNYNFFLRNYNFRAFNFRLNMHVKKTFFLVNHDNKFLSKFKEFHHFFMTRSYDTLYSKSEWLERYRQKRQKKLKKKKKNINNYKNLIMWRISQQNVFKHLDKMHRRFSQLYKYKLKTTLNHYKFLYTYNHKYINTEKIRPFFSVLTSKSSSNISKKRMDTLDWKAFNVFKKNVQKPRFKYSYSKYHFTYYFLQASQKFFSKFSINMSTYLRRSRGYKKISRIRRPMGRFKVLQRKTREYRFKRHWLLRRKKYKMKYIFFSSIKKKKKNRFLLFSKNRLKFFRNYLMSHNKHALQNAPKFLLRNWKLEGHHFFFKRYLRLFIFKILKLQKKKKMLYFLNKKYKLRKFINKGNSKLIFRFFLKNKNRKISSVNFFKNKNFFSRNLFKTYKNLYKKIYIRSTYHFIRRLRKRKKRLLKNHFLRLKLNNNFKILSKIFTIGDLNFRLGFRNMNKLSAWPRKKMSSFFLRSNLIDLIKNHQRKKYFFFSYSRNFDIANRFNRKYFTRWIYRPGFIKYTNKKTMDEIVDDIKINQKDFNLWKSLRWVNKVKRQFAELIKQEHFISEEIIIKKL